MAGYYLYLGVRACFRGDAVSRGDYQSAVAKVQSGEGVLTLYFDDVVKETKGAVLFDENMADSVIAFIRSHMDVDTLLIHCYAGQSRSRAIGAFAKKMMGKSNQTYFSADKLWAGTPNEHVYNMLEDAWFRDMLG